MQNLMEALEVCFQLFEIHNQVQTYNLKFPIGHLSDDYKRMIETIDIILDQYTTKPYPEKFLEYKLEYVSWVRECLRLEAE